MGQRLIARIGNLFYWASSAVAVLLMGGAIYFVFTTERPDSLVGLVVLLIWACGFWLFGRACLYVLAGRQPVLAVAAGMLSGANQDHFRSRKRAWVAMRYISLATFLFAFWLALSGHYTPVLVAAGAVSAVVCMLAAIRIRAADREGHPIELFRGAITYFPWLGWEIAKSAWAVTKIILNPGLPISPTMTVVRASQQTAAGIATYANSITLTPGTITVGVSGQNLMVHALTRQGALDLEGGGMDRRVSQFEGTA